MSFKDYNRWGVTGVRYAEPGTDKQSGSDEQRWGDRLVLPTIISAAGAGTYGPAGPFQQIVQIMRPARVWAVMLSVEFLSAVTTPQQAGETVTGLFSIIAGVGNSRIRTSRDIAIPLPAVPAFTEFGIEASTIITDLPASQLIISGFATVQTVAFGGTRQWQVQVSAMAAPIER